MVPDLGSMLPCHVAGAEVSGHLLPLLLAGVATGTGPQLTEPGLGAGGHGREHVAGVLDERFSEPEQEELLFVDDADVGDELELQILAEDKHAVMAELFQPLLGTGLDVLDVNPRAPLPNVIQEEVGRPGGFDFRFHRFVGDFQQIQTHHNLPRNADAEFRLVPSGAVGLIDERFEQTQTVDQEILIDDQVEGGALL